MGNESISIADTITITDGVSVMLSGDGPPWPDDSPRNHPHTGKYYLAVQPRTVVFSGVITGWTDAMNIQYTEGTWWGTVKAGMTLTMEQNDGTQAVVRVKTIPDGDYSGTLVVAENDHMDWDYNKTVYVLAQFELWPVHPRVTYNGGLTFYKDYDIAYTDQNSSFYPVPIMGPPAVVFLAGGTATIEFSGEHCYTPDGAANSSWSWTFEDGTPATYNGVSTAVSWTAAGVYLVSMTITNAHGKSSTGYRYIHIFDRTGSGAPYSRFSIESLSGSLSAGGWSCSVTVWEDDIDLNAFPPGAQVVLFAEELWDDNSVVSKGMFTNRSNIKMVGWVEQNSVSFDSETGQVSFSVVGIHALMKNCEIFSCALDYDNTPTEWTQLKGLNAILAFYHLIYWQSTLMTVVDVFLPGQLTGSQPVARLPAAWDIKFQDFGQESLWSQLGGLCSDVFCLMAADRCSTFYIGRDPQSIEDSYIGDVSVWLTLYKTDWFGDAEIVIQDEPAYSQITLEGVDYTGGTDTAVPRFAYAPGTVPAHRGRITVRSGAVLDTEELSAVMVGRLYAIANNPLPRVSLSLLGNYGPCVDIAPFRWVQITLLTADTPRNISWAQRAFLPLQVEDSIAITQGALQTSIVLAGYAYGGPGVVITPPIVPPDYTDSPGIIHSGFYRNKHYRHYLFTEHIIDSYADLPTGGEYRVVKGIAWAGSDVISVIGSKHFLHAGFSNVIQDSYDTPGASPEGIAWDGTNVLSSDLHTDKIYKHSGFSSAILDSFAAPGTSPTGISWDGSNVLSTQAGSTWKHYRHSGFSTSILNSMSTYGVEPAGLGWDGSNLLSIDGFMAIFRKQAGFSTSILDSFTWGGYGNYVWGIAWSGARQSPTGNVISAGGWYDKHYRHSGFSDTITDSYTSPNSYPRGITWDGTNVLSAASVSDKHYRHLGFSDTITDSYVASVQPDGITWDGSSVLHVDNYMSADKIYKHNGFSSSITDSYTPALDNPLGITWDGTDCILSDYGASVKIYKTTGFSSSISASYLAGLTDIAGVTWDGTNVLAVDPSAWKHVRYAGFSSSITDSYDSPYGPTGITWDGRY